MYPSSKAEDIDPFMASSHDLIASYATSQKSLSDQIGSLVFSKKAASTVMSRLCSRCCNST